MLKIILNHICKKINSVLKFKYFSKRGDIMKSKELLNRFGKTDLFFWIAATLYTKRVTEPERSRLLADKFNFEELTLEIVVNKPTGIFRKKNFFFELDDDNLKEAQDALLGGEIANWHIRKITASDIQLNSQINQTV